MTLNSFDTSFSCEPAVSSFYGIKQLHPIWIFNKYLESHLKPKKKDYKAGFSLNKESFVIGDYVGSKKNLTEKGKILDILHRNLEDYLEIYKLHVERGDSLPENFYDRIDFELMRKSETRIKKAKEDDKEFEDGVQIANFLFGKLGIYIYFLWTKIFLDTAKIRPWSKHQTHDYLKESGFSIFSWWANCEWMRRAAEEGIYRIKSGLYGVRENFIHPLTVAFIGDALLKTPVRGKNINSYAAQAMKSHEEMKTNFFKFIQILNESKIYKHIKKLNRPININLNNYESLDFEEIFRLAWQIASLYHDSGYLIAFHESYHQKLLDNFTTFYSPKEHVGSLKSMVKLLDTLDQSIGNYITGATEKSKQPCEKLRKRIDIFFKMYHPDYPSRSVSTNTKKELFQNSQRNHDIWSAGIVLDLMMLGLSGLKESEKNKWLVANYWASTAIIAHHSGEDHQWKFNENPLAYLLRALDCSQEEYRTLFGPDKNDVNLNIALKRYVPAVFVKPEAIIINGAAGDSEMLNVRLTLGQSMRDEEKELLKSMLSENETQKEPEIKLEEYITKRRENVDNFNKMFGHDDLLQFNMDFRTFESD